jgi:hypothetical protein
MAFLETMKWNTPFGVALVAAWDALNEMLDDVAKFLSF